MFSLGMQSQTVEQVGVQSLKARQIADYYLMIQKNTQPLTQIIRYNPKLKKTLLTGKSPVDFKPFLQLIVQMSYLLYTCYLRKINILVGGQMLTKPPRRGQLMVMQEVYVEYLLDKEFDRMTPAQQQTVSRRFKFIQLTKSASTFGQFICDFILKIRRLIQGPLQKTKNTPEGYYRQVQALISIIENHLLNRIKQLSPSAVIMSFQESELFREYSLLLKCFNNSLFVSIRFYNDCRLLYQELLGLQQKQEIRKCNRKDILNYATKVQTLIEQAFKTLLTNQVILTERSLEESTQESSNIKHKPYIMGDIKGTSLQSRKYVISIFIKEKPLKKFNGDKIQQIIKLIQRLNIDEGQGDMTERKRGQMEGTREKDKNLKNQCVVQFQASKNLLCVKYITPIELNIENTDVMMFHCNYMSRAWNSIVLEFVERSTKAKKKERLLAFKTVCFIGDKDNILLKIFTILDLLVVYAKVMEPVLSKTISNMQQYCFKNELANQKCEHMRELFIKKIQNVYMNLGKLGE